MRTLRVSFAILIALTAAEATCRLEDWITYGTPFLSPYLSQSDLLIRDRMGVHGRPNAAFEKWSMNALGMRGPAVDTAKPVGTLRVVVAGASEAFGVYESAGREFPRQLEDSLNAMVRTGRCDSAIRGFQVLNSAFRGMSLPTVEQDLRLRIERFDPDVVLYYPTPAQYLEDQLPEPAMPDTADADAFVRPLRVLMPRFAIRLRNSLVDMVPARIREWNQRRSMEAAILRRPPEWRFDAPPRARLEAYEQGLASIIRTIRSIGAVPVLATHANAFAPGRDWNRRSLEMWEQFYPRAPATVIVAFDELARMSTLKVATDSSVVAVDAATELYSHADTVFADFSHFTDTGAAIMGGTLARGVVEALEAHSLPNCR